MDGSLSDSKRLKGLRGRLKPSSTVREYNGAGKFLCPFFQIGELKDIFFLLKLHKEHDNFLKKIRHLLTYGSSSNL